MSWCAMCNAGLLHMQCDQADKPKPVEISRADEDKKQFNAGVLHGLDIAIQHVHEYRFVTDGTLSHIRANYLNSFLSLKERIKKDNALRSASGPSSSEV